MVFSQLQRSARRASSSLLQSPQREILVLAYFGMDLRATLSSNCRRMEERGQTRVGSTTEGNLIQPLVDVAAWKMKVIRVSLVLEQVRDPFVLVRVLVLIRSQPLTFLPTPFSISSSRYAVFILLAFAVSRRRSLRKAFPVLDEQRDACSKS